MKHIFGNKFARGGVARSLLAVAIAATLASGLAACGGGGGGNLRPGSPSSPPVSPPPTSPPPTSPPPPPLVQPPIDAHLTLTHATAAERQGYTGADYRIGVIDTGVNRNHPSLAGRVAANLIYVNRNTNDMNVDDKVGHGTTVSLLAAGAAYGSWPGGIAPEASILSARIINDERPTDDGSGQGNEVTGALGLKPIHQDLVARGMRIMNNSWGGLYWKQATATAPIADEYRFFIKDNDGLVVFATGNESRPDPTNMSALPSQPGPNGTMPAADLEQGWLAVAALDTSDPSRLMYYSNACGLAKSYCLVAPGTSIFPSHTDTGATPNLKYGSGTSYAAPLVSGAAAVVWQKFPYFNNDLVRQTLLGTATDLGTAGPDAVFGYGLLNVAKALDGPGRFDWGDVTVTIPDSSTGTAWKNDISGAGGLIVRGPGALALEGKNTYTGNTRVESGFLGVLGSITSSVSIGATTNGSPASFQIFPAARVKGNVENRGTFASTNVGGPGTIEGNYVQFAGATFLTRLGAHPLQITGTAALQGGNVRVNGVVDGYVTQSRQTLLSATQGLSGAFDGIQVGGGLLLDSTFGYDATSAWLNITRVEVTAAALSLSSITPASLGAASRVESAFDAIDSGMEGVADGFIRTAGEVQQVSSEAAFGASLRSLSGEVHASAAAATYDTLDLGRRALSSRFDDLSSGTRRAGGWMEALGGTASLGSGVDAQVDGWLAGHDVGLDGAMVAGVAFGESTTDSRINGLIDRSRERQTQAQAYLGRQWNQAYLMGQFGAGQWQRQIDRELLLGASRYGVHSDYDGDFAVAGVEAGYRFDGAAGSLVPYLGTEHTQVRSDGFQEQGAAGFGLRTGASTSSRTQAIAGLRASRDWQRISLSGYAEWQQTLASDGLEVSASFVGVDSWSPLAASNPALSGGMVGLSAKAWLTTNSTVSFGYDQRFGPRGDASLVSLKYAFGF
ncbi:autotransporter serine protease [Pseudoxanthomonas daejeonensis]|uniref:autotransporter serine protease n=1 Tax=Pseudoxanthomonas daejeonensis TaxID=266062 RepID=UPI001EE482E7|nr:autotransporter serine protease [Pseudoxanthomonas daejeonensis]